ASIGATSPFVGLFGTVWGIMNSFIGISKSQTTNLAVVAPGIAEALLATAFGLVAAIPAVIIYNHFTLVTKGYLELVGRSSGATGRLLSRDLDRTHVSSHAAEEHEKNQAYAISIGRAHIRRLFSRRISPATSVARSRTSIGDRRLVALSAEKSLHAICGVLSPSDLS